METQFLYLLLGGRGACVSCVSKHEETPEECESVLLPLSESVDEERLDNGILWTIKLRVQIEREGFEPHKYPD